MNVSTFPNSNNYKTANADFRHVFAPAEATDDDLTFSHISAVVRHGILASCVQIPAGSAGFIHINPRSEVAGFECSTFDRYNQVWTKPIQDLKSGLREDFPGFGIKDELYLLDDRGQFVRYDAIKMTVTYTKQQNDFVVPHGACFADDGGIGVFMSGGFEDRVLLDEVLMFNFYFDYVKIGERFCDERERFH